MNINAAAQKKAAPRKPLPRSLPHALPHRDDANKIRDGARAHLQHHRSAMMLDRSLADIEFVRGLLIGVARKHMSRICCSRGVNLRLVVGATGQVVTISAAVLPGGFGVKLVAQCDVGRPMRQRQKFFESAEKIATGRRNPIRIAIAVFVALDVQHNVRDRQLQFVIHFLGINRVCRILDKHEIHAPRGALPSGGDAGPCADAQCVRPRL